VVRCLLAVQLLFSCGETVRWLCSLEIDRGMDAVKGPLLDRMNQVATDTVPGPTVSVSPHGSTT
jgi:hypothetical protein